jgi:organic hydroperoxide reductase OsmC/OhrA
VLFSIQTISTMKTHQYVAKIEWTGNKGAGTFDYRSYSRSHNILIDGKSDIMASSDSAFRGNASKHNPEDLFVSSIAACHMLWYLHLCSDAGIIVMSYEDRAEGTMLIDKKGSGQFSAIVLSPTISISPESDKELALSLHSKAHEMCFLANSCNFEIRVEGDIT